MDDADVPASNADLSFSHGRPISRLHACTVVSHSAFAKSTIPLNDMLAKVTLSFDPVETRRETRLRVRGFGDDKKVRLLR